jgi:hypothetical protein
MANPEGPHFLYIVNSKTGKPAAVRIASLSGLYVVDRQGKTLTVVQYGDGHEVSTETEIDTILDALTDAANVYKPESAAG